MKRISHHGYLFEVRRKPRQLADPLHGPLRGIASSRIGSAPTYSIRVADEFDANLGLPDVWTELQVVFPEVDDSRACIETRPSRAIRRVQDACHAAASLHAKKHAAELDQALRVLTLDEFQETIFLEAMIPLIRHLAPKAKLPDFLQDREPEAAWTTWAFLEMLRGEVGICSRCFAPKAKFLPTKCSSNRDSYCNVMDIELCPTEPWDVLHQLLPSHMPSP